MQLAQVIEHAGPCGESMWPTITAAPVAPGRELPVYQPATAALAGTCSAPAGVSPRRMSPVRTPIDGMTSVAGRPPTRRPRLRHGCRLPRRHRQQRRLADRRRRRGRGGSARRQAARADPDREQPAEQHRDRAPLAHGAQPPVPLPRDRGSAADSAAAACRRPVSSSHLMRAAVRDSRSRPIPATLTSSPAAMDAEAGIDTTANGLTDQVLAGRPLPDWKDDELRAVLRPLQHWLGGVLVAGDIRLATWDRAKRTASLPPVNAGEPPGCLFTAIRRVHSFALLGSAQWLAPTRSGWF